MDETAFGKRNEKGEWTPHTALKTAPVFAWPFRLRDFLQWLPGYFLPWNAVLFAIACLCWAFLTPSEAVITGSIGWVFAIYLRNAIGLFLFYSLFEARLYLKRRQGTAFKYNARFPADKPRKGFLFGNQTKDGMVRSLFVGVPIWTLYEAGVLWMFAKGIVLFEAPGLWWLVTLGLVIPILHEAMFYLGHRLLHTRALYAPVHALHHKAVNPSPWSSLAMHPVEHAIYFSTILLHLVAASHPLLAMYQIFYAGYGAIVGHLGFDRIVLDDDRSIDTHAYAHYLHHKYFEVNYGDGLVPFDKLFGTWHDGSEAGQAAMKARRLTRSSETI